jgi:hypothetical protein
VRGLHAVVGVHNYRPRDLDTAVRFLAAHHRDFPFASLVGAAHPLEGMDAAIDAARRAAAPRTAVAPRMLPPAQAR